VRIPFLNLESESSGSEQESRLISCINQDSFHLTNVKICIKLGLTFCPGDSLDLEKYQNLDTIFY